MLVMRQSGHDHQHRPPPTRQAGEPGETLMRGSTRLAALAAFAVMGSALSLPPSAFAAWQPTRPIEFIIPAGTGGGADIMARTIQGIVTKHSLATQPMVVVNKSGGAGGAGALGR